MGVLLRAHVANRQLPYWGTRWIGAICPMQYIVSPVQRKHLVELVVRYCHPKEIVRYGGSRVVRIAVSCGMENGLMSIDGLDIRA